MALARPREGRAKSSPTAEFTHDGLEAALRAAPPKLGHQSRPDVPAHPRGRLRPQRPRRRCSDAGSAGPRDLPRSASAQAIEKLQESI